MKGARLDTGESGERQLWNEADEKDSRTDRRRVIGF